VRFELTTSCTRNKRATRLRYAPNQKEAVKMPYSNAIATDFSRVQNHVPKTIVCTPPHA
jgi:hypothetical protein